MQSTWRVLPLCCIAAAAALPAAAAEQNSFERGRELTRQLLAADLAPLEKSLSPKFLGAIGGREGLSAFAGKLKSGAGSELQVLEERAFREGGFTSYYRVSRFEKLPSVTTRWVWGEDGMVAGATVIPTPQPAASPNLNYQTRARLRLPMQRPKEGLWYVAWGGRDAIHNHHVRAPDQRFAYDFVVLQDGKPSRGDGARNEDHFCFGEPVVAPAAGRVVVAIDGQADNARPGAKPEKPGPGNHVIIDHGNGEHSLIAHFRQGTVAVKAGQQIAAGEHLGECGNSGTSDLPHIHYHLQTGAAFQQGLGLPAPFSGYFVGGRFIARGEPIRGDLINPD